MASTAKNGERRWRHWGNMIAALLGWPHYTGMPWEYVVCDRRESGGDLEMVHIDGESAKSIRKQVATIIMRRK